MKVKPTYIFRPKVDFDYYLAIIIAIGLLLVFFNFLKIALFQYYLQFYGLLFALVVLSVVVFIFKTYINTKIITVFEDYITLQPIIVPKETKILKSEIINWSEVVLESKKSSLKALYLFTQNNTYKISSRRYNNYEEIKMILTEGISFDDTYQSIHNHKIVRRIAVIMIIIGLWSFFIFFKNNAKEDSETSKSNYISKEQIITSIVWVKNHKSKSYLLLSLKDFSEHNFILYNSAYLKKDALLQNVTKGDTITFFVRKEDDQKKLSKKIPLTFLDKHFGYYENIEIFGIKENKITFLEINDSLHDLKSKFNFWFLAFYLMGIFFFIVGISVYAKNQW